MRELTSAECESISGGEAPPDPSIMPPAGTPEYNEWMSWYGPISGIDRFVFGTEYEQSLSTGESTLLNGLSGGAYSAGEATADVINEALNHNGDGYMFREIINSIFGSQLPEEIQNSYVNQTPPSEGD